jgi:hypothetical protein
MAKPKTMATRKLVSFPAPLAKAIEDFRYTNRIPSDSEAIRQLVETGLAAKPAAPSSGGGTPGSARKPSTPAKTAAPRAKKPTASDRQATAAQTKEAQIRALREQGA